MQENNEATTSGSENNTPAITQVPSNVTVEEPQIVEEPQMYQDEGSIQIDTEAETIVQEQKAPVETIIETPQFTLKAHELREILESVSTLVDEATFEVDAEGLHFRGMDPSHVALVDINAAPNNFDAFTVDSHVKFGVNVDSLYKIVSKNFDQKERLTVSIEDGRLYVKQYAQKAMVRLIESTGGSTPLPKLIFNTSFVLDKVALKQIEKIQTVSEYVTMESFNADNAVKMSGKSDYGEVELTFTRDDLDGYVVQDLNVKESSKATYSLEYLLKFTKLGAKNAGELKIEYSTKMPIRLTQKVMSCGTIEYYLAPRVQE